MFRPAIYHPSAAAAMDAFGPLFRSRSRHPAVQQTPAADLWSRRLRELAGGHRLTQSDDDDEHRALSAFRDPHECTLCRARFRYKTGLVAHYYEVHGSGTGRVGEMPVRPSPLLVIPQSTTTTFQHRDESSPPPPPLPPRRPRRPRDITASRRHHQQRYEREHRASDDDSDDDPDTGPPPAKSAATARHYRS